MGHAASVQIDHEAKCLVCQTRTFPANTAHAKSSASKTADGVGIYKSVQIPKAGVECNTSDDLVGKHFRAHEQSKPYEESQNQLGMMEGNAKAQKTARGMANAVQGKIIPQREASVSIGRKDDGCMNSQNRDSYKSHKEGATSNQNQSQKEQSKCMANNFETEKLVEDSAIVHSYVQEALHYFDNARRSIAASHKIYHLALSQKTRQLQELEQENHSLRQHIEKLELLHAAKSVAETSSYEDLTATPPQLQTAVEHVREAVRICASDFFERMKFLIETSFKNGNVVHVFKFPLQAQLSTIVFDGFEKQDFGIPAGMRLFARPKDQKRQLFKLYQDLRYMELPEIIQMEDFRLFLETKAQSFYWHAQSFHWTADAEQREQFLRGILTEEAGLPFSTFVRLAKATWVLHKLAFAFVPTAEIVRVTDNSSLDEEYMENVIPDDEESGGGGVKNVQRDVAFMVVPGFIVRNTIVKALVHLKAFTPPPPNNPGFLKHR